MATRTYGLSVSAGKIGAVSAALHLGAWMCFSPLFQNFGARGGVVGWSTVLQAGRLEFFIEIILLDALRPWCRLAYDRNKYQEYLFPGGGMFKYPVRRADNVVTLTP